ncbi:MAG: VacJ family lipoprotein [Rhodobacter sp.]|nr:VacJ family lipoprotein [Paracoccaceae bacterium]MCC0075631.1 VacJ family lipoprotein [Rhodobacter sp.]
MRTRRIGKVSLIALVIVASVAGCARAPAPSDANDPYETVNREWFETNLALSGGTERATPPRPSPVRRMVSNFGGNLGLPSTILNDLLQIRPDRAVENTLRFVVNTTVGLGGLFDPAGRVGLHGRRTDFGETLHRWGMGEGAYLVLPVWGPSTERDALGLAVDMVIDPLRFALPSGDYDWTLAARGAARFADAAEYADIIDANVINTTEPYLQARLLYLQTRRYHLGIQAEDDIIDPYADF